MKIERRYLAPEFRVSQDANDAPVITGYAAVFDTQSADMGWIEEIDPHSFDSVLAANPDVRSLWNHNPDFPLGRTSAGTLSLNLDDKGLSYSVIAPDTSYARDLVVSMRRKDVTQSSFGFICKRDQWTDNPDGSVTRRILEFAELIDVSPVTFPAFDAATAGVRSLPDSMPMEFRSRFEKRSDDKPKTKHVDGEDLTADCFLIVGDPDKTDTWKLPWKFSTDEKTKSHLRNALARIDQVKGGSDEGLKAAKDKLADLCKEYDIDVSESKSIRALTDQCTCPCPQCLAGSCGICSADPQCMGAERNSTRSTDDEWRELTMLRLRIAESE
jgi:HK97 family phage prohead protease